MNPKIRIISYLPTIYSSRSYFISYPGLLVHPGDCVRWEENAFSTTSTVLIPSPTSCFPFCDFGLSRNARINVETLPHPQVALPLVVTRPAAHRPVEDAEYL